MEPYENNPPLFVVRENEACSYILGLFKQFTFIGRPWFV